MWSSAAIYNLQGGYFFAALVKHLWGVWGSKSSKSPATRVMDPFLFTLFSASDRKRGWVSVFLISTASVYFGCFAVFLCVASTFQDFNCVNGRVISRGREGRFFRGSPGRCRPGRMARRCDLGHCSSTLLLRFTLVLGWGSCL